MHRSMVVFPEPLGPISAMTSPCAMDREMPRSTPRPSNPLQISFASSIIGRSRSFQR